MATCGLHPATLPGPTRPRPQLGRNADGKFIGVGDRSQASHTARNTAYSEYQYEMRLSSDKVMRRHPGRSQNPVVVSRLETRRPVGLRAALKMP
jgi:hypothetical protein